MAEALPVTYQTNNLCTKLYNIAAIVSDHHFTTRSSSSSYSFNKWLVNRKHYTT